MRRSLAAVAAFAACLCGTQVMAQAAPAPPVATPAPAAAAPEPIVTILRSPQHSVLARLVQAAGLQPILAAPGPFTLFAPDDTAFARLAPGTVESLLQPANRASLVRLLTFHLLPEAVDAAQLTARIGSASVRLTTVEGTPLLASAEQGAIRLTDAAGNRGYVTATDGRRSNGIVHTVNGVLVPPLD